MSNFLFAFRHFSIRLVAALFLLFALYNPTAYSYVAWVMREPREEALGGKILVGILFVCALVYLVVTAHKTMGRLGMALAAVVIATASYLIVANVHYDWSNTALIVLGEIAVALLFAFGMSAATINRNISGQVTTNPAGPVLDHHDHHGGNQ